MRDGGVRRSGRRVVRAAGALVGLGAGGIAWGSGSCAVEEVHQLGVGDSSQFASFGHSVSVAGGYIVVGVPSDDVDGDGQELGSAFLYSVGSSSRLAKYLPSSNFPIEFKNAGWAVAMGNGRTVLGCFLHAEVFIFDQFTGVQVDVLSGSDTTANDRFGSALAVEGDVLVVGAYGDNSPATADEMGSAYIFDLSTNTQLFKLTPFDGAQLDQFGYSVDIENGIVAIGCPLDDDNGLGSGSVYLYDAATGGFLMKLLASDGAQTDQFGRSVAMSGDLVVVGAPTASAAGPSSGAAYVFDATTGAQVSKLVSADLAAFDSFGVSVAISGGIAVVGAYEDDDDGNQSGSAYLFDAVTGRQLAKLTAGDAAVGDAFGRPVAMADGVVVVGAPSAGTFDVGKAYLFATCESACGPGAGSCGVAHGTPGCDDFVCCQAVCGLDPFCCDVEWDADCAAASGRECEALPVVCPGSGSCQEPHATPGCADEECCPVVCAIDPTCCQVAWDEICVGLSELCYPPSPCPGEGDCLAPHGTPGCDDAECCETVCAVYDSFCCDEEWDEDCVDAATFLCFPQPCPGTGDCCVEIGTPSCGDAECCEMVCAIDPFCCALSWDFPCSVIAQDICDVCQPLCPGEGDCCTAHGTPGCEVEDCCTLVCALDLPCCEVAWDQMCVDLAISLDPCGSARCEPPLPECTGSGPCCEAHAGPGCDDEGCCSAVCSLEAFCCDVEWDQACADLAAGLNCGGCSGILAVTPILAEGDSWEDGTFTQLKDSTTAGTGSIMTRGTTTEISDGLWIATPRSAELIVKASDAAPGIAIPGVVFGGPLPIQLFDAAVDGTAGFASTVQAPDNQVNSQNDEALWYWDGDSIELIAHEGQPSPESSLLWRGEFRSLGGAVGQLAFRARTIPSGGGAVRFGIWRYSEGEVFKVANAGDVAPDSGGATMQGLPQIFHTNDSGGIAFSVGVTGSSTGVSFGTWRHTDEGLMTVRVTGDQVPGLATGVTAQEATGPLNNAGDIFAWSFLSGEGIVFQNNTALWIETPNDESVFAAQRGQAVPGMLPLTFETLMVPMSISDSQRVLFRTGFRDAQQFVHGGLCTWEDGELDVVAFEGDPIPGFPGITFDDFSSNYAGSTNDLDQIVFQCTVLDGLQDRLAVLGWTAGDGLFPIVLPGMQLFIGGEVVTVHSSGLPENSLAGSPLGNDGEFALRVLTDDAVEVVATGNFESFREAFFGPPPPPACPADLSGDGQVNSIDLNAVLGAFGSASPSGDVNGSGFVDSVDLNAVLALFGQACPES